MQDALDEIKSWGWLIVLLLAGGYMALRDKLGLDFVRRRELAEMDKKIGETKEEVERVEHSALGAHDKMGEVMRRQDALEHKVESINQHGSEPARRVAETLNALVADMREIKTHLRYLRNHPQGRDDG